MLAEVAEQATAGSEIDETVSHLTSDDAENLDERGRDELARVGFAWRKLNMGLLALLFFGSVIAAAISGAVGFGGALLLLPLLIRVIGPEAAVPLLTVAQLVGNLSRALFGVRSIAWKPALIFLIAAMPSAVVGSYCFVAMPKALMTRTIGVALLLFLGVRASGMASFEMTLPRLAAAGVVVGFLSGLVGSAGPLGAAAFLALDLPPLSYIATEATTAVAMHATKMTVYVHFLSFDVKARSLALLLSVGMIVGSWLGKKSVERLPATKFRLLVGGLLLIFALQMVIWG